MPELPEVEFARRSLVRWFKGRKVVRAEAEKSRIFRGAKPTDFEKIRGKLTVAERKGKYLMLGFDRGHGALAHLGMTGKFVRRPKGATEPYSRARFVLDDGSVIHFRDPRMFGRIEPVPNVQLLQLPVIAALGRDPLTEGLNAEQLKERVARSGQPLKVALMDQARIAGLGNIHAAEALFRAGIHPGRTPKSLTDEEWTRLTEGIHAALAFALEAEDGEEIEYVEEPGSDNPFLVYGRAGERCSKCGSTFRSFAQGGRTTHFCPGCQPARKQRVRAPATRRAKVKS